MIALTQDQSPVDPTASAGASPPGQAPPDKGTLRVAYIMSRFPKLTETFVLYEMLALEEKGVAVEVFPLIRQIEQTRHPEAERLARRAHYHPFLSLASLRATWHFLRRDPGRFLRMWWEVLSGTWGSANFFFGALGILPKTILFARRIEELGVRHVHAHFANHPSLAALVVHRLTGIPFSFTAHGSDLHVERRMLEAKVRAAAFVVTVSSYNKDLIAEECGEDLRDRIRVIHCGVDPEAFSPRDRPEKRTDEALKVVCVASLEEVKGHRFLIQACRHLEDRGIPVECGLVGDGPLRRELTAQAEEAGLGHRIRFHGGLPRPEVARLMGQAHVAVLASHPTPSGKREGIPVALMEAMATGLPVVASAISGIPELVQHRRTGILVPPGDPEALADALELMDRDRHLRKWFGAAGRHKVHREFDLRAGAGQIVESFLQVGEGSMGVPADGNRPEG
jgi:colanic acid/amylovoran biosynthesis glycosyltransferase